MKVKNSIQVEPPPTVGIPRILVSYYHATMKREEYDLVSRLITDLQAVGIDVMVDEIQDIHVPLKAQLQSYDWILLIQTNDGPGFAFVKERLAKALNQNGRHYLQGTLHILVGAPQARARIPTSDMSTIFDACIDYPRAFAGIVLKIYPDYRTRLYGVERGAASSEAAPSSPFSGLFSNISFRSRWSAGPRHLLYILLIAFTLLILLGAIITHSFASSSVKPATSNRHTNVSTMIATTTTPQEAIYRQVSSRTPVINDALQSQSASQWDVMQQQGASCAFTNGSYHVSILPPFQASRRYACLAQGHVFAHFAMQVDMQLLQGDVGGMIFHADGHNAYTWFAFDAHGCYKLVHLAASGQIQILSDNKQSCLAINMHNTNQLTVIAQSSNIYLYIDGRFIQQFPDPSLTKGKIGLIAIERTQPTDAAFTNLKVWQ